MMTNTVSLELAKELWELGLKIETEKWWNFVTYLNEFSNPEEHKNPTAKQIKDRNLLKVKSHFTKDNGKMMWVTGVWGLENHKAKELNFKAMCASAMFGSDTDTKTNIEKRLRKYVKEIKANLSYPAPSTDELLDILPDRLKEIGVLKIYKFPNEYEVTYASIYAQTNKLLCEALGLMCKYLLQNGFEFNGKEIVRKGD